MSILSELVYARNSWANLLPLCRGLSLFAMKAHQSLYRIGSRLAQCTPYATTRRALIQMAKGKRDALVRLWNGPEPEHHIIVLDNIQALRRRRDQRIGTSNKMITGTGATAVKMEDCPPGAFDLKALLEKRAQGERRGVTVERILESIDWDHQAKISAFHWLDALVFFVPALAGDKSKVADLFSNEGKKHQIDPKRHSTIHPLGTNSANEVSTHGMKDAVSDFLKQLGINESTFKEKICFFTGDGKTFEGINKVKRYLSNQTSNFRSFRFIIAGLELWHTKWTDLSRICSGKWGLAHPTDPSTLGFQAKAINHPTPSDLKKVDFYSHARLLEVCVRAHMLHCWEWVIPLCPGYPTADLVSIDFAFRRMTCPSTFRGCTLDRPSSSCWQ